MIPEILEVSNGTTTVSFLNEGSGFILDEWEPKITQKKDGGVWKSSGVSDGRQLALKRYENVEEIFLLKLTACDANTIYNNLRRLRELLNQAESYWITGFSYQPVWLKVKGKTELYPRYALITGWSYEDENNPFHPPMGGNVLTSSMDDFEIIIERKPFWTNSEPGSENPIEAGQIQNWDGRWYGNVDATQQLDPTTEKVFFANKDNIAQLTDIYEYDGGSWSANLLNAVLPHRIMPAVPAVGDAMYFGIDTSVSNSGPFCNLVFDIGTPADDFNVYWEYYDGATWTGLSSFDNMAGFSRQGVGSVCWNQEGDWSTCNLNAVLGGGAPNITGWWVRCRVLGILPSPTGGTQQNRDIYTVNWPYIEIQSDQITGDLPALAKIRIRNESSQNPSDDRWTDWIVAGARGVDRGEDFSAYIPLADQQLLTGQSMDIAPAGYIASTYINDVQFSPRNRSISVNPGDGNTAAVEVTLDSTIANQYKGRFHMYLRTRFFGSAYTLRITARAWGNIWVTDWIQGHGEVWQSVFDFGGITLPPAGFGNNEDVEELVFFIEIHQEGVAVAGFLHDLILIPADEWIGTSYCAHTSTGEYGPALEDSNYLDIDSVTFPKRQIYTPVRTRTGDYLQSQWSSASVGPVILDRERNIRIWFLSQNSDPPAFGYYYARYTYFHSAQLFTAQRYLSAIGADL